MKDRMKIPADTIPSLLMSDISRDLILRVEDALTAGARRAFEMARGADEGHLAAMIGQNRHFNMNEGFFRALTGAGASPSPIRGNGLVTGRQGIFSLARFNTSSREWNSGRRSQLRRQMALANLALEPLVQNTLFDSYVPPSDAVVFFVACFSGSLIVSPDAPISIQLAVPDHQMKNWLFAEPLNKFVQRYTQQNAPQEDKAIPTLKTKVDEKDQDGLKE
jgi:hypothetical protein